MLDAEDNKFQSRSGSAADIREFLLRLRIAAAE